MDSLSHLSITEGRKAKVLHAWTSTTAPELGMDERGRLSTGRTQERARAKKERSEGSASIGWSTHRGNKLIREAGCLKFEREPKGSDGGTDLAAEKEREPV